MTLLVSLIILGLSLYLFILTRQRIVDMKEVANREARQEIDAVITEFNRSAVRNIEILEDKLNEMQRMIEKADKRIFQLDHRIARSENPIVIEKIVQADPKPQSAPKKRRKRSTAPKKTETKVIPKKESPLPKEKTRSEQLKELLLRGTSTQELLSRGFHENEINLTRFLLSKK